MVHSQRTKYVFLHPGFKFLPTDPANDICQQHIPGIAVAVLFAWSKIELSGLKNEPQGVFLQDPVAGAVAANTFGGVDLSQPTGVIHQAADGDRPAEIRCFGQISADIVVQPQFTLLSEQDDAEAGQLLGYGADIGNSFRCERNAVFQTGEAVAFGEDQFALVYDGDGAAGISFLTPFPVEIIDLLIQVAWQFEGLGL